MNPWSSPPSLTDIIKGQVFTFMFAEPTLNSLWSSNLIRDVEQERRQGRGRSGSLFITVCQRLIRSLLTRSLHPSCTKLIDEEGLMREISRRGFVAVAKVDSI
jgi:hypothetical protein